MPQQSAPAKTLTLALLLASAILSGSASAAPIDTTRRPGPPDTEWNIGAKDMQTRAPHWTTITARNPHQIDQVNDAANDGRKGREPWNDMRGNCPCMGHMPKTDAPLSPDAHKALEDRIAGLRTKLAITPEQEPAWQKVEQAMRANESSMRSMIQEKRAQAGRINAVESMERACGFAQAHADNLANVIPPFRTLYSAMTEEQRKNADAVFKEFRGMGGGIHHHHRHHHKAGHKHTEKRAQQESKAASPAATTPHTGASAAPAAPTSPATK